ncbi:MAG: hypothetical protein H6734_11870 [Alphaproteobacteria bacterium]|nr:hypothetical protein [Alphaproteobacteria bacterium]
MLTIVALHALAGPLDLRCPEGTTLRQRERHAWCLESIDGYRHHHRRGPEVWLASDGRVTMRREHGPYGCAVEERYGPGGELVWRADTVGCTRGEASWYDADGTAKVRGTVWLDQVGPEKLRGTWDVDGEQVDVGSPDPRRPAWRTLWSIQHAALGPFATPAAHSRVFQDPGDVHVIEVDTVAHGGRAWRRQVEDVRSANLADPTSPVYRLGVLAAPDAPFGDVVAGLRLAYAAAASEAALLVQDPRVALPPVGPPGAPTGPAWQAHIIQLGPPPPTAVEVDLGSDPPSDARALALRVPPDVPWQAVVDALDAHLVLDAYFLLPLYLAGVEWPEPTHLASPPPAPREPVRDDMPTFRTFASLARPGAGHEAYTVRRGRGRSREQCTVHVRESPGQAEPYVDVFACGPAPDGVLEGTATPEARRVIARALGGSVEVAPLYTADRTVSVRDLVGLPERDGRRWVASYLAMAAHDAETGAWHWYGGRRVDFVRAQGCEGSCEAGGVADWRPPARLEGSSVLHCAALDPDGPCGEAREDLLEAALGERGPRLSTLLDRPGRPPATVSSVTIRVRARHAGQEAVHDLTLAVRPGGSRLTLDVFGVEVSGTIDWRRRRYGIDLIGAHHTSRLEGTVTRAVLSDPPTVLGGRLELDGDRCGRVKGVEVCLEHAAPALVWSWPYDP